MKGRPVKTWSTPVSAERKSLVPCALCGGVRFRPALSCEGFSYVRCGTCGLVQINPQPLKETVEDRYGKSHGGAYLAYELENEAAFLRLQELALEDAGFWELESRLLGGGKKPRVLDLGCATGALLERLRDRGWEVFGVEISPSAEYARTRRGLPVSGLPLEESRLEAGSFDAALASHLIEHLNDPRSFVRELGRVLAPGGKAFLTTPNIAGFQARLFGSRWRSAIFDHLYLFSARTLSALLRQEGFAPEKTVTWGGLAGGTASPFVKKHADRLAKALGFGDVMIIRAGNVS